MEQTEAGFLQAVIDRLEPTRLTEKHTDGKDFILMGVERIFNIVASVAEMETGKRLRGGYVEPSPAAAYWEDEKDTEPDAPKPKFKTVKVSGAIFEDEEILKGWWKQMEKIASVMHDLENAINAGKRGERHWISGIDCIQTENGTEMVISLDGRRIDYDLWDKIGRWHPAMGIGVKPPDLGGAII